MIRNDGIGGTPRLARYTSIGTPRNVDPTPNRPPLPRRTPGETDIDQDPRFRLASARSVAPAPAAARRSLADSVAAARATEQAREDAQTHLPSRHGDCPKCEETAPCRPFRRALTILDTHDPGRARRVRAVLAVLALPAPPPPGAGAA
ncbi:hypothetical protein O7623_12730 [Solwaraspora sp. WMMD791]|uniref:hypothetical protein n=1 Tax=Solwaraspora sp. WMMD791 TaxID=3016086 RepID=UPI00249C15D2|nr:hypothetical protein [Solwaraspora sp. WMMD791]WFE29992.1 hypothetical protein O7623_12730 [Solwaraspora sp. WMMD791]